MPIVEYERVANYRYALTGRLSPIMPVRLISEPNQSVDFTAVVDTGAEFSLFRAVHLQLLGRNLFDGEADVISAVAIDFPVYKHSLTLSVFDGFEHKLSIGFSELTTRRDLLGRDFLAMLQFGLREHHGQMFFKLEP